MTIKQLGGVFGRNPTFNDVTIEGQLTFDGDIDINSDLKVDGDLDVTGNAGIGIDAGTDVLQISDSAPIIKAIAENGNSGLRINVTGDSSNTLRVQSNGASKIELNGNNLKINSGSLQIANAGSGIDFSATAGTGTSELLDDYEEGTWTVTLYDAVTGGNASPTTQTGYYTKIGNQVTAYFRSMDNIDTTGMTAGNNMYVSLPFASGSEGSASGGVVLDRVTYPTGYTQVNSYVPVSVSRGSLRMSGSGVGDTDVDVGDFNGTTSDIQSFTLTYFV